MFTYNAFGYSIKKKLPQKTIRPILFIHTYMFFVFPNISFSFKLRGLQQYYRENKCFYIKWKFKMNIHKEN